MPRDLINPSTLHAAPGYSHVAIARGERLVYVAGQVALDPAWDATNADVIGVGDLGEQTRAAMRNVGRALEAAGATWDDVVRRTIYTTRPTEWDTITSAIDEVTGGAAHPAQTVVGVVGLALPDFLIEIECTAAVAGSSGAA